MGKIPTPGDRKGEAKRRAPLLIHYCFFILCSD